MARGARTRKFTVPSLTSSVSGFGSGSTPLTAVVSVGGSGSAASALAPHAAHRATAVNLQTTQYNLATRALIFSSTPHLRLPASTLRRSRRRNRLASLSWFPTGSRLSRYWLQRHHLGAR